MSDLEIVHGDQLVHPGTGEVLPAHPDTAADIWKWADDQIRQLQNLKADCVAVLVEESRVRGTKTLHLQDFTAVISGGPSTVYDPVELQENLRTVGCPEERIDQLVTAKVEYRINHNIRRQLVAANEMYAQAIELASHEEERAWRATIK